MSAELIVEAVIVIAACIGFVVVGTVYHWDFRSVGYSRWTRAIGVVAVVVMGGVAAWSRRSEPTLAVTLAVGGGVLAVVYAVLHRRVSARVRELLAPGTTDAPEAPSE